jgi:hypothetical protein
MQRNANGSKLEVPKVVKGIHNTKEEMVEHTIASKPQLDQQSIAQIEIP